MQNENSKLNKDFKLSQQADQAQKAQEAERQKRFETVKDEKDRRDINLMMQTRDREIQRDMQLKQEEQKETVRKEIQRRLDAQKAPSLDFGVIKRVLGKSPDMVHDQVKAEFKDAHEKELAGYGAGLAVSYNKTIDKHLDKTLEAQRQREAEPKFQKDSDRSPESSKDAFQKAHDQTGGEKDWRSLKADRERDAGKEREK